MGDVYSVTGRQDVTTATPGDTSLTLNGVTTTRGRVKEWTISTGGTPADNAIQWLARRHSASGTGTAVSTIAENDLDGPVALIAAEEDHTVEPTYTAGGELFDNFLNQRATYRWVATPNGEWLIPATSDAGVGWTAFHASYTGSAEVSASWAE